MTAATIRLQEMLVSTIHYWEERRSQGVPARIAHRLFRYLQSGEHTAESAYWLFNTVYRRERTEVSQQAIQSFFRLIKYCHYPGMNISYREAISDEEVIEISVIAVEEESEPTLAIRVKLMNQAGVTLSSEVLSMYAVPTVLLDLFQLYSMDHLGEKYLEQTIIKSLLTLLNLCLHPSLPSSSNMQTSSLSLSKEKTTDA